MKATRKLAAMLGGALLTTGLFAAPSVEITAVQQQYPWTNTVDITYEVRGVTNMEYFVRFTPTTSDDKEILDVNGEPSIQVALTNNGTYVAQWYPQTNLQYTACKMTPAIFRGGSGGGRDYMIIDLENWTVTYEPMATQEASNERYNTDEYKTTKMVMRRIPQSDSYYVGEEGNTATIGEGKNPGHTVSISKDYYIGIFSVTEAQHGLLSDGALPTTYANSAHHPKLNISYNTLRGSALTPATPVGGVCATLDRKLGMPGHFDLPTETMWEIAARAEWTTVYPIGDSYDETAMSVYAQLVTISPVGLKRPNAWGIYDPEGNCWNICRDVWCDDLAASAPADGLVPVTTGAATYTCLRCGDPRNTHSTWMRLSARNKEPKANGFGNVGYRMAYIPE